MREHTDSQESGQADSTASDMRGNNADNSSGPTPADAIGAPANSTRDSAAGGFSESKARDPEYYAERDIPSEG